MHGLPHRRRDWQTGNSEARRLLEQKRAGAVGSHPQAPGVRSLPAHAARECGRYVSDVSRPDPEHEAGLPGVVAQHGVVHQLSHRTVEPAIPSEIRLQLVSLLTE